MAGHLATVSKVPEEPECQQDSGSSKDQQSDSSDKHPVAMGGGWYQMNPEDPPEEWRWYREAKDVPGFSKKS